MDNSDNLALIISESNIMGNILQSTNESKDPESENSKETVADSEVSALTVPVIEVSGKPSLASNTFKNVAQATSLSKDVENVEEWLQGDAKHLVKVEADEDFEGIVKSLETAIVETQNYDMESGISSLPSTSISKIRCVSDDGGGVVTSESLMGELSKDLNRSEEQQFAEVLIEEQVIINSDLVPIEATLPNVSVSSEVEENFIAIEGDMVNFEEDQTNDLFHNSAENEFSETELSVLGLQSSTMSADIPVEIGQGILRQRTVNMRNNLEIDPELSESSIIYSTGDEATNDGILNPTSELQKSTIETQEQKNMFSSSLKVEDTENNTMEVQEISIEESNLDFKGGIDIAKQKIEETEKYAVLEEKLISESIVEEIENNVTIEEEISCKLGKEATEKVNVLEKEIPSEVTSQQSETNVVLAEKNSTEFASQKIDENIVLEEIIINESTGEATEKGDVLEEKTSNESTQEEIKEDNVIEEKIASEFEKVEVSDETITNESTPAEIVLKEKITSESIAQKSDKEYALEERITYEAPPEEIENNVIAGDDMLFESATEEIEKHGILGKEISSEATAQQTKKDDVCEEKILNVSTSNDRASCAEILNIAQESVENSELITPASALEQDENMEILVEPEVLVEEKMSVEKSIDLQTKKNIPNMETEIQEPESLQEEELAINALLDESVEDSALELEIEEEETINFNREDQEELISMREEDIAIRSIFSDSIENLNSPPIETHNMLYQDENIENDTTEEQRDILQLREEEIAIRNLLTESANDSTAVVESNMEFEQDENIINDTSMLLREEDIAVRNLLIKTDSEFEQENFIVEDVAIEQEESTLLTEDEIAVNSLLAESNIETQEQETEQDSIIEDITSGLEIHSEVMKITAIEEDSVTSKTAEVPEITEDTVLQEAINTSDTILEDKVIGSEDKELKTSTEQSIKIVIDAVKEQDETNSDNKVYESTNVNILKHRSEEMDTTVTKEIESNISKETNVVVCVRNTTSKIEQNEYLPREKTGKSPGEKEKEYDIKSADLDINKMNEISSQTANNDDESNTSDLVINEKIIGKISEHLKETTEKDNKSTLQIFDQNFEKPMIEYEENVNQSKKADAVFVENPSESFKDIIEKNKIPPSYISEKIAETSTENVEQPKKSDPIIPEKISDKLSEALEEDGAVISEKVLKKCTENVDKSKKFDTKMCEKVATTSMENLEENIDKNKKSESLISEKIAEKLREIEEMDMLHEQIEKSTSHLPQKVKLVRQRFPKVGTVKVQSIKPHTTSHVKKVATVVQASKPDVSAEVQKPVVLSEVSKPVILSEVSKPADNTKTEIKELKTHTSPKCDVSEEKPILDETKLAIIEQLLEESEEEVKTPIKPQKLKLKRNYQPPSTIVKPHVKEITLDKKIVKDVIHDKKNDPVIVKKDVDALSSKKEESVTLQSSVPKDIQVMKNISVIVNKDMEALSSKKEESVTLQSSVPEDIHVMKSIPVIVIKDVEVLSSKKEESVTLQSSVPEAIQEMKNIPVLVNKDVDALSSTKEETFTLHSAVPEVIPGMMNNPIILKKDMDVLCSKKEELVTLISESPTQKESKDGADNEQPLAESSEKLDTRMQKIDALPDNYTKTDRKSSKEIKITKNIQELKIDEHQVVEEQSEFIPKVAEVADASTADTIKEIEIKETLEIQNVIDILAVKQEEILVPVSKEIISAKDDTIIETFEVNTLANLNIEYEDNVQSEANETFDSIDAGNEFNQLKIIDVFSIEDRSNSLDLSDRINTGTPEIQNVEVDDRGSLSVVENLPGIHLTKITTSTTENIAETPTIHFPLLLSRLQDKLDAATKTSKAKRQQEMISKQKASLAELPHIEIKAEQVVLPTTSAHISPRSKEMSKLRSSQKRKHSPDVSSKQAITKPLSVEIDDLETSDANYETAQYSLTPTQKEHENIRKIVIKHIPRPEQRSSPKITIKPIKPPSSPEVSSKKMKHSDESSPTRLTIKSSNKQESLKITFTKQKTDDTHSILKIYQPEDHSTAEDMHVPRMTIKPKQKSDEMQHSPKITIKPVKPAISPKVTVKPILPPSDQGSELTSTPKSSSSKSHLEESYPKVTIKPVLKPEESHKSSQLTPRQIKLKSMSFESSSGVTVEPVCSTSSSFPSHKFDQDSHIRMSSKSYFISEESSTSKLSIKPITKTCEIVQSDLGSSSPLKLTIKPLKSEESYQSPKITIKPIVKPDECEKALEETEKPERIILKIQKTNLASPKERSSTHVKESKREPEIKIEAIPHYEMEKNQKLDKIKLKLTKEGGHAQIIPTVSQAMSTETFSLKRSLGIPEATVSEKRIKSEFSEMLHSADISINIVEPNSKPHAKQISEEVTIMKIEKTVVNKPSTSEHLSQMKFKEMLMKISQKPDITCIRHIPTQQREDSSSSDDVKIVEVTNDPLADPLTLQEDSTSQDVVIVNEIIDTNPFKNVQIIDAHTISESPVLQSPVQQSPKRRGRPRKNPLEVKPEIKGEDCIELDATRPKRTCRAPAGRTPFAIKERKPRGAGRGRGSPRGARGAAKSALQKIIKETKASRAKALKEAKALAKLEAAKLSQEVVIDEITIEDSTNDTPAATTVPLFGDSLKKPEIKEPEVTIEMVEPVVDPEPEVETELDPECTKESPSPAKEEGSSPIVEEESVKQSDPPVAVYEDETRMSASENNSRAQTPARQDVFIVPFPEGHEESQSSVQSTATTESNKNKKGRLEICDPDSAVTTVEQIVEYSWANGGPYMLQEQIAQYLGVKSFKRKYPGLNRRPVEMQERDYIREKGLVSESMCDMGLTAVPSSEILDIMYSDFQEKYEEYRKCLRDKQSKEISNKQRAISLATTQEKNKLDFKERAIRSAQNWNSNFNKVRKENRKCCMDLQTFTVNYPSGVVQAKVPHKTPVGHYPVALVPGQYTDYWKNYNSSDLKYLPLNTVRFGPMLPNKYTYDGGQSDGSSESDSSSGSDSDSSDESMSTEDETPQPPSTAIQVQLKTPTVQVTPILSLPKK